MILVTGATGNAGGAVLRALVSAGEQVRGLIRRDADQARLPAGVEGVTGDLNRPQSGKGLAVRTGVLAATGELYLARQVGLQVAEVGVRVEERDGSKGADRDRRAGNARGGARSSPSGRDRCLRPA